MYLIEFDYQKFVIPYNAKSGCYKWISTIRLVHASEYKEACDLIKIKCLNARNFENKTITNPGWEES